MLLQRVIVEASAYEFMLILTWVSLVLWQKSGRGGVITPVGFLPIRAYVDILLLVWFAQPR